MAILLYKSSGGVLLSEMTKLSQLFWDMFIGSREVSISPSIVPLSTEEMKLEAREGILSALRDEKYLVTAECFQCGKRFTQAEIMERMPREEYCTGILCPDCLNTDVFPWVLVNGVEHRLLAPLPALLNLKPHADKSPDEIRKIVESTYYSIIFHFGSLRRGFQYLGIRYNKVEVPDWKKKVKPFIGTAPNTVLADVLGVMPEMIARL